METIQGYATVTQSHMSDLETGGRTTLSYPQVAYNLGLPDDIFTERSLRNPP